MNENDKRKLLEKLQTTFKNEIRITFDKSKDPLSADASKIGGRPALPDGFTWPYYAGKAYGDDKPVNRPLAFLAQINLKDTASLDKDGLLPQTGMLSFFYERETETWGYDPKDKGSARVFYFPDVSGLKASDFPETLDDEYRLPEYELNFESHISFTIGTGYLPWYLPKLLYNFSCADAENDLDSFLEENGLDLWDNTKLLGYPFLIQNPMEEECETVTRGYSCGSPEDMKMISEEESADIQKKSAEWILLFQMSGINNNLSFGDDGNIYFWIRKQDLANKDFSKVWLILQCY